MNDALPPMTPEEFARYFCEYILRNDITEQEQEMLRDTKVAVEKYQREVVWFRLLIADYVAQGMFKANGFDKRFAEELQGRLIVALAGSREEIASLHAEMSERLNAYSNIIRRENVSGGEFLQRLGGQFNDFLTDGRPDSLLMFDGAMMFANYLKFVESAFSKARLIP